MAWKLPPKIKIYEALGSVADGRVTVEVGQKKASVKSSSGGKDYIVIYDPDTKAIMTNDKATYWQGYLGYPAIAFLLEIGKIDYDKKLSEALKGILWKDVNTRFKYDFDKTEEHVLDLAEKNGFKRDDIVKEVEKVFADLESLQLEKLGKRIYPPEGY